MQTKTELLEMFLAQLNKAQKQYPEDNPELINTIVQSLSTPIIMEILIDIRDELTKLTKINNE